MKQIQIETPETNGVGMEVLETRRVPGGPRTFKWRVTEYAPPARWGYRGVGNPVNAVVTVTLDALDGGATAKAGVHHRLEAAGLWKLMAALARRGTREELPRDLERLKRQLECG